MISNEKLFAMLVNEWAEAMKGYSQRSVKYGLDAVNKQGSDFAPTLPAFLNLCEPVHIYDHCDHLLPSQRPQHLLSAEERAALPSPSKPPFSFYEQKLKQQREEKERFKHLDDDLEEKRAKFLRDLQNITEAQR